MGSVIFSTIGQAVAGPLGGAAAAMAGSALDTALSGRGRRARVPEFRAPTSAYGDAVPEIYGVARVSGVLLWALPFARSGATKGGSSDRSAFTASFALALSARRIARIGRIWADGRLIRDADGAFGFACTMRTYRGVPDQPVDPLVAAAEGLGTCPAYRRLAYVVFEDFPLATFGNRIPALSFEVHADDGSPAAPEWIGDQLRAAGLPGARCTAGAELAGYVALGPTARDDVEALSDFLRVRPIVDAEGVAVRRAGRLWEIPEAELGARRVADDPADAPATITAGLADGVAGVAVSYLDPERDFQRGTQQFGASAASRVLDLSGPFSASASAALRSARGVYLDLSAAVERIEIALSWDWLAVAPNDRVRVASDPRLWRVAERLVEAGLVRLTCEAVSEDAEAGLAGDHGRILPAPVERIPPSRIVVIETPVALPGREAAVLRLFALAAEGWTGAALGWAAADEESFAPLGNLRTGMANGVLVQPLAAGPETAWDEANLLVLSGAAGAEDLVSRSALAVLNGANLLLVGDEILQFRQVRVEPDHRLVLSGLLRGRLGTLARAHPAGTPWHAIQPWASLALDVPGDAVGMSLAIQAAGAGDPPGGTRIAHVIAGAALAPLAPCHLRIERSGSSGLRVRWTGRERAWVDWAGTVGTAPRWYRARLRWSGAALPQPLELRVEGDAVDLPPEAVADIAAAGAGELWCEVVAEGDGPMWVRTTGERRLLL